MDQINDTLNLKYSKKYYTTLLIIKNVDQQFYQAHNHIVQSSLNKPNKMANNKQFKEMFSKEKGRSKTLHFNKQQQLNLYAAELMRRQQIQILNDLKKSQLRKQKVKQVQTDFQTRLEQKHKHLRQKMQNSQARRAKKLQEKVKKCQNYQKSLAQKQNEYKRKKRQSMKSAWNEAEKFNSQHLTYLRSKHSNEKSFNKSPFLQSRKRKASETQSVEIKADLQQPEKQQINNQNNQNVSKIRNMSLYPASSNNLNNFSRHQGFINTSIAFNQPSQMQLKNQQSKQQKVSPRPFKNFSSQKAKINFKEPTVQHTISELDKMRWIQKERENQKIKNLMKKLQNIDFKRKKRIQKFAKKKQSFINEQQRTKNGYNYTQSRQKQKQNKKRIISETGLNNNHQKRTVTDWSMHNRLKRQQLEQEKFNSGNQYLQFLRIRHMKYALEKNVIDSTIQRKLYMKNLKKAVVQ